VKTHKEKKEVLFLLKEERERKDRPHTPKSGIAVGPECERVEGKGEGKPLYILRREGERGGNQGTEEKVRADIKSP